MSGIENVLTREEEIKIRRLRGISKRYIDRHRKQIRDNITIVKGLVGAIKRTDDEFAKFIMVKSYRLAIEINDELVRDINCEIEHFDKSARYINEDYNDMSDTHLQALKDLAELAAMPHIEFKSYYEEEHKAMMDDIYSRFVI